MKQHEILRESWVWNGTVEEFIRQKIIGYSLNIPCGKSLLGDIRIDLEQHDPKVRIADMNKIPYPNNTFDTVIQDPPWKIGFYHRMRPFFECVRICKVGGQIIYNAYWIPDSKAVQLKEVYIRQDKSFTNTSIISIFEKITDEFDGEYPYAESER